jgi:hypothetical protein
MRSTILAFWIGVIVTYIVLTFSTFSTTVDADVVPTEATGIGVAERVDQGTLSRLRSPGLGTLGTLRVTKRSWGLFTTYAQELTVTAARLAQQAGTPVGVRVSLELPGTVTGTNATARDGRTLVWNEIPPDAPMWARTRAVSWPVVLAGAVSIALTFWGRAAR